MYKAHLDLFREAAIGREMASFGTMGPRLPGSKFRSREVPSKCREASRDNPVKRTGYPVEIPPRSRGSDGISSRKFFEI